MDIEPSPSIVTSAMSSASDAGAGAGSGGGAVSARVAVSGGVSTKAEKIQKGPRIDTEDDHDVDSDDDRGEGAPPRDPKNRFAVFFGYVGARYQGLQK